MEKMKSIWQIADQVDRICWHARWRNGNENDFGKYTKDPYYRMAMEISKRYYKNIQETQEWKDAFQKAYDFKYQDPYLESARFEIVDAQAKTAGYGSADHVKVPMSVYAKAS